MSKSRHHHNLQRSSHDLEQRQQEQPLLVDAGAGGGIGGGTGNTCMMVDDDELKMVTTDGCPDRTASTTVVDGVPMALSPSTAAGGSSTAERSTGAVRRPSIRGLQSSSSAAGSSSTTWKLKYQDFMPTVQPNIGLWDKSEPFQ